MKKYSSNEEQHDYATREYELHQPKYAIGDTVFYKLGAYEVSRIQWVTTKSQGACDKNENLSNQHRYELISSDGVLSWIAEKTLTNFERTHSYAFYAIHTILVSNVDTRTIHGYNIPNSAIKEICDILGIK